MSFVTYSYSDHIAVLQLERPERGNAINFDVMDELEHHIKTCYKNDSIRVLILTGSGRFFISGGDLKEFHHLTSKEDGKNMALRMQAILSMLEEAPFYTIAGVNGQAYGGGCETLLACDFVVAAPDALFGFTQGRFYLPPGWGGATRLAQKVGSARALQWLGSCTVLTADEARQNGLITTITQSSEHFLKQVYDFAQSFTHNDRTFIANLKKQVSRGHKVSQAEAIKQEIETFASFWADHQHIERVQAFLREKNNA